MKPLGQRVFLVGVSPKENGNFNTAY